MGMMPFLSPLLELEEIGAVFYYPWFYNTILNANFWRRLNPNVRSSKEWDDLSSVWILIMSCYWQHQLMMKTNPRKGSFGQVTKKNQSWLNSKNFKVTYGFISCICSKCQSNQNFHNSNEICRANLKAKTTKFVYSGLILHCLHLI